MTHRLAYAFGGVLLTAVLAAPSAASAATAPHVSEVVSFKGPATLGPVAPDGSRTFVFVSDTCKLVSDGETATPCQAVVTGTSTATGGGSAHGFVVSREGVIKFTETVQATGPTTVTSAGMGTEIEPGSATPVTLTGFSTIAPTGNPNVIIDESTITFVER